MQEAIKLLAELTLDDRLAADTAFGACFYRAFARITSQRLGEQEARR